MSWLYRHIDHWELRNLTDNTYQASQAGTKKGQLTCPLNSIFLIIGIVNTNNGIRVLLLLDESYTPTNTCNCSNPGYVGPVELSNQGFASNGLTLAFDSFKYRLALYSLKYCLRLK